MYPAIVPARVECPEGNEYPFKSSSAINPVGLGLANICFSAPEINELNKSTVISIKLFFSFPNQNNHAARTNQIRGWPK